MHKRFGLVFAFGLASLVALLAPKAEAVTPYGATETVSAKIAQETTKQAAGMISARISQAVSSVTGSISAGTITSEAPQGGAGRAAGNDPYRWGVWANGGVSWLAGDQQNADFRGTIKTFVTGLDRLVTDDLLVGVALGYEHADIRLKYNNGRFEANNIAVSPYIGYIINNTFSLDATAGYALLNYDLERNSGNVRGSTDGSRWFGAANLNANTASGPWRFGSSLGYLYLRETTDAYTESDTTRVASGTNHLGQARLAFKLSHVVPTSWGSFTPYGQVRFEYDVDRSAPGVVDNAGTRAYDDRFGTAFTVGASIFSGNRHTFGIEASTTQFRSDISDYSLVGNYRLRF